MELSNREPPYPCHVTCSASWEGTLWCRYPEPMRFCVCARWRCMEVSDKNAQCHITCSSFCFSYMSIMHYYFQPLHLWMHQVDLDKWLNMIAKQSHTRRHSTRMYTLYGLTFQCHTTRAATMQTSPLSQAPLPQAAPACLSGPLGTHCAARMRAAPWSVWWRAGLWGVCPCITAGRGGHVWCMSTESLTSSWTYTKDGSSTWSCDFNTKQ